jgi:hypothetical protein
MTSRSTGNPVKSLSLLEQGREDVYFARRDRELIAALHRKAEMSSEFGKADAEPGLIAIVNLAGFKNN